MFQTLIKIVYITNNNHIVCLIFKQMIENKIINFDLQKTKIRVVMI
jgi:hypothetical protein